MARDVEGVTVVVEFLCETDEVEPGRIFRPKGESTGSSSRRSTSAVRTSFATTSSSVRSRERLDEGGRSKVAVRVASLLPYTVLPPLLSQ